MMPYEHKNEFQHAAEFLWTSYANVISIGMDESIFKMRESSRTKEKNKFHHYAKMTKRHLKELR
ncbi:CLUMA_CG010737, isoform A [Clunio marinus]|uniref:CLUMA_CG010737, isoform A n=1 Tax=Clunio marinus TaxID=568069 RepID=A0A1J1IC65_9DIPT|nr:CLUMA_CG010737, isoform A [Clunio marinus]